MADKFDELFGPQPSTSNRFDDLFGAEDTQPIPEFGYGKTPVKNEAMDLARQELEDPAFATSVRHTREASPAPRKTYTPEEFLNLSDEEKAAISARGEGDGYATTLRKTVQNWPERIKGEFGGLLQSVGQIEAQTAGDVVGTVLMGGNGAMSSLVRDYLSHPLEQANQPVIERGKAISDKANAAQEANAPDFGDTGDTDPRRYLNLIGNGIMDMLVAAGVTTATRSPRAGVATLQLQVFGQQYDESRQMGRAPEEAFNDGVFNAVAEGIGEAKVLGDLMKPGKTFAGKVVQTAKGEAVQEIVTQVLQTGYDMGVLHPDMTWGEALAQIRDAGIVGGATGAAVAATTHPFTREQGTALGMDPETAAAAEAAANTEGGPADPGGWQAAMGKIRETAPSPEGAQAMRDLGIEPGLTPEDQASPIPDEIIQTGKSLLGEGLAGGTVSVPKTKQPAAVPDRKRLYDVVETIESGGRDVTNPKSGATGPMQTMPGTLADPGFGVEKAKDNSVEEKRRVGRDYLDAMMKRYGSNTDKALAAYNWGPGHVDDAVREHGKNWRDHLPDETKDYIAKAHKLLGTEGDSDLAEGDISGRQPDSETVAPSEPAATVEDTLKQAGIDLNQEDEIDNFEPGQRVAVTQNDETVPGTVEEVYGKGDGRSVRIQRDDGTTFDENVKLARQYGARFTRPKLDVEGERIDKDWVRFNEKSGTLGIPRSEMPQVKGEHRGALVNYLKSRGIEASETETVPASSLKPTQAEFSPQKAASWDFGNMKLEDRSVLVSSDGHILDGHHQWVKAQEQGKDINVIRLNAPIRELLPAVHEFPSSTTSGGATAATGATEQQATEEDAAARDATALDYNTTDRHERVQWMQAAGVNSKLLPGGPKNNSGTPFGELPETVQTLLHVYKRDQSKQPQPSTFPADTAVGVTTTNPYNRDKQRDLWGQYEEGAKAAREGREPRYPSSPDGRTPVRGLEDHARAYDEGYAAEKGEDYRDFANMDTLAVLNSKAATSGKMTRAEVIAYTMGAWEKTGRRKSWANQFDSVDLSDPAQKKAYTNGKLAAIKELNRRGVESKETESESTAPEHKAVGVDDRELGQIVEEFGNVADSMGYGEEKISHIFDEPNAGIVRLQDKVKVYNKEHGWMTPAEAAKKIREWEAHAVAQGKDPKARSENGNRIVLSFFDLSGEWSAPWDQAGYQVWRFDIQNDPEMGDVNNFSAEFFGDWFGDFDGLDVYAILSANPCTDFASSGARHFAAKDKDGRTVASVKLVHQTLAAIEYFKPAVWAIENPVGRIQKLGGLPHWRLSFDPNHIGETYTKKTLIWGRFNGDLPIAPVEPVDGSIMHKKYGGKSLATKNARSVTPEGFAYSFFMANNAIDHPAMAISNKYDRLDQAKIARAVKAGVTEAQISEAVDDFYYQDLDDEAANKAIDELTYEARHRKERVSQAKEDAKNLGPAEPQTREEAEIALEGGRKVKVMRGTKGNFTTYSVVETSNGWTVVSQDSDLPVGSQLGGGIEQWSKDYAIQRAMESIEMRLPKPQEPTADQPTEAPITEAAVEELRTKAQPHQEELEAFGRDFASFKSPGVKGTARILEKAIDEGYTTLGRMKDIVRGGFFAASKESADHIAEKVKAKFTIFQDKGWQVVDGNYLDHKLIIDFGDGILGEVQIVPQEIWDAKESGGREMYVEWRTAKAKGDPRAPEMLAKMEAHYANAVRGTAWESDFNALISASGKALEAAASESGAPSLVASPGAERQEPESQTTAQSRPPEAPVATSRDSTSKNETPSIADNVGNAERSDNVSPGANRPASDEAGRRYKGDRSFYRLHDAFVGGAAVARGDRTEPYHSLTNDKEREAFEAGKKFERERLTPTSYGDKNKVFTKEKADAARELIRAKLRSQVSSGFDPEFAMAGMQIAGYHIEAGVRKFADLSRALAEDLGVELSRLKPYIAAWYNGARDLLEGQGEDISDMDGAGAVRAAVSMIADPQPILSTGVDDNGDKSDASTTTPAGAQEADSGRDAGADEARASEDAGRAGEGVERPGDTGTGQLPSGTVRDDGSPGRDASGTSGQRDAGTERSSPNRARSSRRVRDASRGTNFRAAPSGLKREGGWLATANRNLDIIEKVNELEASGRAATPEEQELLSKYVGWGASEIRNKLFASVDRRTMTINAPYYSSEWSDTINRARELLKGDDLKTALQSTQYAHYTSEGVIRGMWDAMQRLGFQGGRILEPGMGIGHFFTASPDQIADHSTYTGIEFDSFTAKIAKHLLPQENVMEGDFIKLAFPDGFFDAAIGNPPFSATKVLNDPAYKKQRFSLHDYFFAKSIDKVRPGGLLAFVTSRYTMDKLDSKARDYISERADFLGAIRLPEDAFRANAGTDVVTDILFFQRRAPGVDYAGQEWKSSVPVTVGGQKVNINEYFAKHPEMVLGKHELSRGMYRDNELTVKPYASKGALEKQLAEAVGKLPENVYTDAPKKAAEATQAKTYERDFAPSSTKEGGVYLKDGKVLVVDRGSGVPIEAIHDKVKPADHAWLKSYVGLRDALKEAQKAQLLDEADWEPKLEALRKAYRAHVKKHGRIKEFTAYDRTTKDEEGEETTVTYRRYKWDRLMVDIEAPLVSSLEKITDAGDIVDGPFLLGRTLNKPARPVIETVNDALAVTLDEIGKLDFGYMAKLLGRSEDQIVEELGDLVFQTPAGEWQTADEYLSGDVLQKLEEAQEAVKTAPELERNVTALLAVQPKPLSYDKITVRLGAPWLKPETIQQFTSEVLGFDNVPISYETASAHWTVEGATQRWQRTNTSDFGTPERSALELLDAVLNNRSIKITMKDSDGKTHTLPDQTAAANEAAKKIGDRFKTWLWEDSARTSEYVELYNRKYNNLAPRRFDGSHLTLPGLSALFKPHPHVKRAVWRIIQTGNTYLAHAVGAGKTAEQIISGMEQRRLGLIKKPMYVVPNHMLKQFSQEFLELYPAANIMVADEQAFHTGNRQRFLAQAALNDPDAIILTHSSFGKIDTSPAMRDKILGDMIAELEDALEDLKSTEEARTSRHLVSKLEKQIEALTKKFESKTQGGKDKLLTFDEMGVDFVYVDEAHEFRKLDFATNRNAKGIDAKGSARALDLFIKSQYLESRNPGRSMVLASGTPVTNTMAELYTVMRYLDLKGLERDQIAAFDAWANMFGEVVAGYERNAAGGYEVVERFAKFVNVPELMKRVRNFMDVLLSSELGDLVKRPKINGGGPQNVIAPQSEALKDYMEGALNVRLEKSRAWKPSKEQPGNPDPVINIITDARLSSIDMRFVSTGRKADPQSKLNQMISKIAEVHKATANIEYLDKKTGQKQPRKGAAQIVFSPVGLGEQVALNRGFDVREWIDSELVRQGVKKSEIGWMSDANTHAKKEQLQKDVRSGKVRILIGSPKNMGTGLNVQDRLIALHFLAPPWYPADVVQPHGRIERQGNLNDAVDIYWYATEGTYDSTGWGMVARKQKFIDDALSGDDSVRTLEDISEINMFEMAAALAAGDDRVIRIAALSGEVEKLTRLKGAHADTQRSLRSDINTFERFEIPRLEERQTALKAANEARGTGYNPMSVTVGGATYDKHGEAGDALKAAAQDVIDNNIAIPRTVVGKLYGKHPIILNPTNKTGTSLMFEVEVGGHAMEVGRPFNNLEDVDSVGLIRSIESKVQGIPSLLQDTGRMIADAKRQLEAAKRKYGAPFADEQALSEAIAERAQLQQEMAAETEAKNKPPAAPVVSALELEAEKFTGGLTPEQVKQGRQDLETLVQQLLPGDKVALRVSRRVFDHEGKEAAGLYWHQQRLIEVALAVNNSPTWTLGHEVVHAMNSLGLFTEAEWNTLVRDAWHNDSNRQADVLARWGHLNLTEEELQEEAVAESFGEYFDIFNRPEDRRSHRLASLAIRAVRRAMTFIAAVARVVAKLTGKTRAIDSIDAFAIQRKMESGKIGARPVGYGMQPRYPREGEPSFTPAPPTNSEAFKRWFGKSLLKNRDGSPTVYYHGTLHRTDPIDAFDRTKAAYDSSRTINALGTWFADTPKVADIYAGASRPEQEPTFSGGAVYPVYLKIEHPMPVDAHDLKRLWQAHAGGNERLSDGDPEAFRAWLRSQGYDGLIMKADDIDDGFGTRSGNPNAEYVVALDPSQVKSAVGNNGEFNPADERISHSVAAPINPAAPDPEYQRRRAEAKKGIGSGPSVIEKASAWWQDLTGGFTRHWRALPNTPRFADASQKLRNLEAAPEAATAESIRYLRDLVGKMDAQEYDLFSEKVLLDDLAWDAGEGRDLPFGLTPTKLKAERVRVDAAVNVNPKVIQAVRKRKVYVQQWTDRMVESGVLTREQVKNPAYFRHMVLDYARHEAALARGPNKVKSPYWAKRMGSTLDINANFLEAEMDWLQKAQIDVRTAETLEWVKDSPHNRREELRARARDDNRSAINNILANNPAARKEDGWFRSNIARGFQIVKEELEAGNLDPIPAQLQGQADAIMSGNRDGEPPYALMGWILDGNRAGAMGAGMVLKYSGLRKQWRRKLLGERYVDPEDVKGLVKHYKPEGFTTFQPIDGRHLFTAKTISESALDMFVTRLADTAAPGIDRAELAQALGSVRQQLVVGGERYTMVLPEELAATLEEFGDRRGEGMVAKVFGGIQSAWKRWVLINPRRFLKYNLNNQTGDLDAIIAGKPRALLRVKEAWTMLHQAAKGNPSQRYTEALERGVFTAGLSVQEIPDINRFSEFRHLLESRSLRPDKLLVNGVGKLWRVLQDATTFRENLFRLAAYIEYADEIDSGKPQLKIGYGASIPKIVDAVTDPRDKAALLARDLIGDYGAISVAGHWLRRYLIPFWSWTEINTRRYWRLSSNAFTVSTARGLATGGLLGGTIAVRGALAAYVRIAMVYGLLYLWNHGLFGDEEDELSDEQAAQLHLILGRDQDGKVVSIRTQGALSDVLKTLGFTDAMLALNKWRDGQGSLGSVVTDMLKAPVNRVGTAVTPLFSVPVEEMIGRKLWPDLFEPRIIHDKWRHLFQTVSLENEYDAALDRPSRGYAQSWVGSLVYKRDPGEMAYDEARDIAYSWLERTKGGSGGGGTSERSEALRDYRMALRYGDQSAAVKALLEYERLGGTKKSLKQSIRRAHPLGPIAKKDRKEFLSSLTDEQLDTFAEAEDFWKRVYANPD